MCPATGRVPRSPLMSVNAIPDQLLLPPNRLRPSFFAIFFKRLDKNQRNFRSEHLRTCPNFHYLDILLSHKYFRHFPLTRRGKWGKVSHLFSWLRGGETMKIELFFNIDCESLIFCEQIRGKIKNRKFSQTPLKCCFAKSCVLINFAHGWGKMIQHAGQYKYSVKADSHQ